MHGGKVANLIVITPILHITVLIPIVFCFLKECIRFLASSVELMECDSVQAFCRAIIGQYLVKWKMPSRLSPGEAVFRMCTRMHMAALHAIAKSWT